MHEIITLQFGNQSNYLGTHFWNAQESYFTYNENEESLVDHDIHFRPGVGADGSDTFTPRTLIYDIKENFGTLRQTNALYEIQHETDVPAGVWGNTPIIRHNPPITPHPYQVNLDSGLPLHPIQSATVRFWSDYNHIFYHPRSLVQLHLPTSHIPPTSASSVAPLDKWETGEDLFKTEDAEYDLLDRDLRPFVEECDQLQGIQVVAGADDAWAGFAGAYVERLRDEFGRKSVWVWGVEEGNLDGVSREKRLLQTVNLSKSASSLAAQASLYIPVSSIPSAHSPPYLNMDPSSKWQTSALQATVFESATLPTRLRAGRANMADLEATFTNEVKMNMLQLSLSVSKPEEDAPVVNGGASGDHRMTNGFDSEDENAEKEPEKLDIDLFRSSWGTVPRRGTINSTHTFAQVSTLRGFPRPPNASQDPIIQTFASSLLSPRLSSFPAIFNFEHYQQDQSIAVKTALAASTNVAARMRFLAEIVGRVVVVEEREELKADLLAKAEEYVEGWESEGGSDDE